MTQQVPATAVLGPGKTGLTIGVTVLNIDGTTYAAFSATGVAETSVLGTYRKANGVVVPDAGGYLVWGVSGTDYAEATVEPAPLKPTVAGRTLAVDASGGVDVGSISGDSTAADNLEAMLDGTRAKLYLSGLDIVAAGNDSAIVATGAGSGHGIDIDAGATGRGVDIVTTDGDGIRITAAGASKSGLYISATGSSSYGMRVEGVGRGMKLYGQDNQALYMASDFAAATIYIEGPGDGGDTIHISSPSFTGGDAESGAGIHFEMYQGRPAVRARWWDASGGAWVDIDDGVLGTTTIDAILAAVATQTSVDDLPTNSELATALASADDAVLSAIADVPTVAEFEARTLLAADYTVVGDLPSVPSTADIKTELEADGSKLDHLWEMTEDDGGVRRLTANALEEAPAGGSGTADWTSDEREQIRYRLQLDGTQTAPMDADPPAVNVTMWKGSTAPAMTGDSYARLGAPVGASVSADIAAVASAVASVGAGDGAGFYTDTVESPTGTPLDGVRVVLATDEDGDIPAYEARTDAFGVFAMRPDPGTYYLFIEAAGHDFTQGTEVTVVEP